MRLIDTHTHIYGKEFDEDREQVIHRAKEAGVAAVLLPNEDADSIESLLQLCNREPSFAYPMLGLHPTSIGPDYPSQLNQIESALGKRKCYGIGEIGMDLYWSSTYLNEQKIVFEEQLKWSIDLNLPIDIHCREAYNEIFNSIHRIGADKLRGVFHCFAGTNEDLDEIKRLKNFKIGINGVITFKHSPLPEIIRQARLDMLLLETDAPYLSPVPHRGKRNEPAYICITAQKIAEIFNMDIEKVAEVTTKNALEMFNISTDPTDVEGYQSKNERFSN